MVIILEGPNKCGKSLLAKYLVKNNGFAYFKDYTVNEKETKPGKLTRIVTEEQICAQARLINTLNEYGFNLVLDRFHISEYVYGKIFRGYNSKAIERAEEILTSEVKLIVLSDVQIKLNERNGKDMSEIADLYIKGYSKSKLQKCLLFDIFSEHSKQVFEAITKINISKLSIESEEKIVV